MTCAREKPCDSCRCGVFFTYGEQNYGFEQCNACKRFPDAAAAGAFLRRLLDWADDLPDALLPDIPPKGTTGETMPS